MWGILTIQSLSRLSVSANRLVGCGFESHPGHTKDCKYDTDCLPDWQSSIPSWKWEVWSPNDSWVQPRCSPLLLVKCKDTFCLLQNVKVTGILTFIPLWMLRFTAERTTSHTTWDKRESFYSTRWTDNFPFGGQIQQWSKHTHSYTHRHTQEKAKSPSSPSLSSHSSLLSAGAPPFLKKTKQNTFMGFFSSQMDTWNKYTPFAIKNSFFSTKRPWTMTDLDFCQFIKEARPHRDKEA